MIDENDLQNLQPLDKEKNENAQKGGENVEKRLKEQDDVLANDKKNMLVSASAGSGKTYIMIKYICQLVVENRVPISKFLVLTFTKSAANQMKAKLLARLKEKGGEPGADNYIAEQIDALSTANICTIDSFCERCLKKYAGVLGINESFSVIDESYAKNLKQNAFEEACQELLEKAPVEFELLMSTYKNNKEKMHEIVDNLSDISNSVADRDEFLGSLNENFEEKFDAACKFLFDDFQNSVSKKMEELEQCHVGKFEDQMKGLLEPALSTTNLMELYFSLSQSKRLPARPSKNQIGQEVSEKIFQIKEFISKKIELIKSLSLDDNENVARQKSGVLEKAMLKLFDLYERQYSRLKNAQNGMDFADLEKYMKTLSQNEKLFDGLSYVFVDEYQDTNKIQEKIIKNIAKNCNFVAVGDLKQGIYGFRLASSEIFLKDLQDFDQDENSSVNFLKSNFRSNQHILDFVNNIFKVCMKEETANVDYFSTSMLKAENDFVEEKEKAINIDLIVKKEQKPDEIPMIYSVKNAEMTQGNANEVMLLDIKKRINDAIRSKISDHGKLRPVTFSDIAILARGRDGLFNQLETFLQESGIPVLSNSRTKLAKEPEIQMLVNYLRIARCMDDEVAVLSVLLSGMYLLDIQKVFDEKFASGKSLLEIVKENRSGLFSDFLQDLTDFRTNSMVFGVKKAFLKLFAKTNYLSYLNLRTEGEKLKMFVEKFLSEVEKQNFDIPALIHYFDSVEIVVSPEASSFGDCVTLTTIHDSKGLEYPIVFLLGCDKNFLNNDGEDVQISEKFGMALKVFDLDDNSMLPSVRLCAIQQDEKEKDFVEEMMIFYVALTRAKNRLYLFGNYSDKFFLKQDVKSCSTYFDFIFFALKKEAQEFLNHGEFEGDQISINYVENVEELLSPNQQDLEEAEFDDRVVQQIENYIDFSYKFGESKNFRLKESVTNLNKKFEDDALEKFSNENFNFGGSSIKIGNAYHLALKLLDFEKIFDEQSLHQELEKIGEDVSLIDEKILLKDVLILKNLTEGAQIFKEKEFLLKEKISNLLDEDVQDDILVQGVVDLFAVKDGQAILVDYKFSSSANEEYLINKYKYQLKLYKRAIEEAYGLKVSKSMLLSLKFSKLILVDV